MVIILATGSEYLIREREGKGEKEEEKEGKGRKREATIKLSGEATKQTLKK